MVSALEARWATYARRVTAWRDSRWAGSGTTAGDVQCVVLPRGGRSREEALGALSDALAPAGAPLDPVRAGTPWWARRPALVWGPTLNRDEAIDVLAHAIRFEQAYGLELMEELVARALAAELVTAFDPAEAEYTSCDPHAASFDFALVAVDATLAGVVRLSSRSPGR